MQVLKRTVFGVLIMRVLRRATEPVPASKLSTVLSVAAGEDILPGHIQQILIPLLHAGLVSSTVGPYGGYGVTQKGREASIYDVDHAVEMRRKVVGGKPFKKTDMARVSDEIDGYVKHALSKIPVTR